MSTTRSTVTVTCDTCGRILRTNRTTTKGARGDAARKGWHVDSIYTGEASSDHTRLDLCRVCFTYLPDHGIHARQWYWHRDGCSALAYGMACTCDWSRRMEGAA